MFKFTRFISCNRYTLGCDEKGSEEDIYEVGACPPPPYLFLRMLTARIGLRCHQPDSFLTLHCHSRDS
jgi:hypothetical protein